MIKFSIITPFYKGNKYVSNLIKMAETNAKTLLQANLDASVELIIVNDSPSETVEISTPYEKACVRVINHEKNGGIHQARITGLSDCEGEYILFLDQDDEIVDDCLLTEYKAIGNHDVVIANAWFEKPDGTQIPHYRTTGQFKNALELAPYIKGHNRIISPGHCLIRKSAIPVEWTKYIMKDNGSDDLFLWILMFLQNKTFTTVERPLYTHKHTGHNLSAEGVKMAGSTLETASYLEKIDYVPRKIVKDLTRSRRMEIDLKKTGIMGKLCIIIKNLDIYFLRIMWKIRGQMREIRI